MSHFIRKCECGKLIAQCRCIGPKVMEIVRPCVHIQATTMTTAKVEPITINSLYAQYERFMNEYGLPQQLRCDPIFYERLKEWAAEYTTELYKQTGNSVFLEGDVNTDHFVRLFGVPIKIDFTMPPGEWKFEDLHTNGRLHEGYTPKDLSNYIQLGARADAENNGQPRSPKTNSEAIKPCTDSLC